MKVLPIYGFGFRLEAENDFESIWFERLLSSIPPNKAKCIGDLLNIFVKEENGNLFLKDVYDEGIVSTDNYIEAIEFEFLA